MAGADPESFVTSRADRQQTAIITDPADIADYAQRHTFYAQLAVVGDPARAVLARLANEYQTLA